MKNKHLCPKYGLNKLALQLALQLVQRCSKWVRLVHFCPFFMAIIAFLERKKTLIFKLTDLLSTFFIVVGMTRFIQGLFYTTTLKKFFIIIYL